MTQLLCLGDSITDCGRLFDAQPLGNGYVSLLSQKLRETGQNWSVSNCGIDGLTVARLLEYVRRNAPETTTDVVTVLIGINDIGLMMNTNRSPAQQAHMMDDFSRNYEKLLQFLSKTAGRIVLMEPFIFPQPAEYRLWFPYVEEMSRRIKNLADQYKLPYAPLHNPLNHEARIYGLNKVTVDGIHLTTSGHEFVARTLLPFI